MFKKIITLALSLLMVIMALASCTPSQKAESKESDPLLSAPTLTKDFEVKEDFKMGLICLHDENSTYDNNFIKAFNSVKSVLGLSDEQALLKVNVPETSACYDAARDLAEKGCKLIFADSFGHESYVVQAAKEYQDVQFVHMTGTSSKYANKDVANFHNAFASIYEGRYLAGIAAGLKLNEMIESGKITADQAVIGYVGAFTYAEVISGMTSFYLGARSVCPSATMKVRYTGSWYDQAKEMEAANSLITNDKCVLISQHADSLGAPTACEVVGVPNVSYNGSTISAGKNSFVISSAINWAPFFFEAAKCINTDTELSKDNTGTIATGAIVLSGINLAVAADGTKEAIDKAIAELKAGTLHVFDTSKFTVDGKTLTEYKADVDGDFVGETNVIHDGYFDESGNDFRSAPYFDIIIDGITNLNTNFGD